jgi:hypothetical protein
MYKNPFENKSDQEIHDLLSRVKEPDTDIPCWPNHDIQKGWVGVHGLAALKMAQGYLDLLKKDGAFSEGWKGLDYACGWGRFASLMLQYGSPDQLDMADAWLPTLNIVKSLGFKNKIIEVPEILEANSLEAKYSFIFSFSLFTHLNDGPFKKNVRQALNFLRPAGVLYITVRDDGFISHKFPERAKELCKDLVKDGFLFVPSRGDRASNQVFGDSVVTEDYLFGSVPEEVIVEFLGAPTPLQRLYALRR